MRLPRVRFMVRRMMVGVAVAAVLLGLGFCMVNHLITSPVGWAPPNIR
jgi:hypothetical protein